MKTLFINKQWTTIPSTLTACRERQRQVRQKEQRKQFEDTKKLKTAGATA